MSTYLVILKKHWILIVGVVLLIILKIPTLSEPLWYDDEAITLTVGQEIHAGAKLYADVQDNKPPLLYWLAAWSGSLANYKLILLVWAVVGMVLFYVLLEEIEQKLLIEKLLLLPRPWFSLVGVIIFAYLYGSPRLEGNIINGEVFMLPGQIGALFALLRWQREGKNFWLYVSGVCLGLASLFKIPAAVDVLVGGFCLVMIFWQTFDWKRLLQNVTIYLVGFMSLWIIVGGYFIGKGTFYSMIKAVFLQNWGYLSAWSSNQPVYQAQSLTSHALLWHGAILVLIGIVLLLLPERFLKVVRILVWWLAVSIFGALLSGRPYTHYVMETVPAFVIVLCLGLFLKSIRLQLLSVMSLLIFAQVIILGDFWHYEVKAYYSNYWQYITGWKSYDNYQQWFDPQLQDITTVADWAHKNTTPADHIYVWGNKPAIYVLSQRRMVVEFVAAYHVKDFNGYDEVIRGVQTVKPQMIIWGPGDGLEFAELKDVIAHDYQLAFVNERYRGYVRQ